MRPKTRTVIFALAALAVIITGGSLVNYTLSVYEIRTNALNLPNANDPTHCEQGPTTQITFAECRLRVVVPATRSSVTAALVLKPYLLLTLMYTIAGTVGAGIYYLLAIYRPSLFKLSSDDLQTELVTGTFLLRIAVSGVCGFLSFWLVAGTLNGSTLIPGLSGFDPNSGFPSALIVPFAAGIFILTFMERVKDVISKDS